MNSQSTLSLFTQIQYWRDSQPQHYSFRFTVETVSQPQYYSLSYSIKQSVNLNTIHSASVMNSQSTLSLFTQIQYWRDSQPQHYSFRFTVETVSQPHHYSLSYSIEQSVSLNIFYSASVMNSQSASSLFTQLQFWTVSQPQHYHSASVLTSQSASTLFNQLQYWTVMSVSYICTTIVLRDFPAVVNPWCLGQG